MSKEDPSSRYELLATACNENINYFKEKNEEKYRQLITGLVQLQTEVQTSIPVIERIRAFGPVHDFKNVPANGYRSFAKAADKFCAICLKIVHDITKERNSIFFYKKNYAREINYCAQTFATLNICLQMVQRLNEVLPDQTLFLDDPEKIDELENYMKRIDVANFYGPFVGFQFCETVQSGIRLVAVLMATYAQHYYHKKNLLRCLTSGRRFLKKADLRAAQLAEITNYRKASTDFCKKLWNLTDTALFAKMRKIVEPKVYINHGFEIQSETLEYRANDRLVTIPAPSSHIGSKPTNVRLFSSFKRQGMEYFEKIANMRGSWKPPSDWFIFHIHGGGFVAQSSDSHQIYLANWSKWIKDTPILSVDYSLAPEAPYPRALEEVFYAYVWALNNANHLGTNAKRIIFAGDSAGGNLCLGLALKCIENKIRLPDGIFCAYTPTILRFYPSPSRFLSFMDPVLPFGFLGCLLKAYTQIENSTLVSNSEKNGTNHNGCGSDGDISQLKNNQNTPPESIENSSDDVKESTLSLNLEDGDKTNESLSDLVRDMIENDDRNEMEKCQKNETRRLKGVPEFEHFTSIAEILAITQNNIYLSPATAPDDLLAQMPPTVILTTEMDLCLDDCVLMAKRLEKVNRKTHLDVLEGLNHGFLNFKLLSKDAHRGCIMCAQRMRELLEGESHKDFNVV